MRAFNGRVYFLENGSLIGTHLANILANLWIPIQV